MADDHLNFLLGVAAIERHRHLAAGFNGADAAVEFVGRFDRIPIELRDDITQSQSEEFRRTVDVQLTRPGLSVWARKEYVLKPSPPPPSATKQQ